MVKATPQFRGSSGSAKSLDGMIYVRAALGKAVERPCAWSERGMAAKTGVGGLNGGPGPPWVGQRHDRNTPLVGLSFAGWRETSEWCAGSTEVLAAGVAARTWVGLDISD